jgi:large subunit ribosomal protein L21
LYAILEHGGHQYRVTTGDRLLVDRLPADVGSTVRLEPVLFIGDGETTSADRASLSGAHVTAVVVAHRLGHKIRVFSYKPKKRHRRTLGYRSKLTELRVDTVVATAPSEARKRRAATAKSSATSGSATSGSTTTSSTTKSSTTKSSATPTRRTAATRKKAGDGA